MSQRHFAWGAEEVREFVVASCYSGFQKSQTFQKTALVSISADHRAVLETCSRNEFPEGAGGRAVSLQCVQDPLAIVRRDLFRRYVRIWQHLAYLRARGGQLRGFDLEHTPAGLGQLVEPRQQGEQGEPHGVFLGLGPRGVERHFQRVTGAEQPLSEELEALRRRLVCGGEERVSNRLRPLPALDVRGRGSMLGPQGRCGGDLRRGR